MRQYLREKVLQVLLNTQLADVAVADKCANCPCRDKCALWLWDVWNINFPMCACIDERLVWLENSFAVNQELLNQYRRFHPHGWIIKVLDGETNPWFDEEVVCS